MAAMTFPDLEAAYDALAVAIDDVGQRNEALFLTKLVILLAQQSGDLPAFQSALAMAKLDLPQES